MNRKIKAALITGLLILAIVIMSGCTGQWPPAAAVTPSPAPDETPLFVSQIQVWGIDEMTVDITWSTNKPATSQVEYGVSESYGQISSLSSELVTSHSVILRELKPEPYFPSKSYSEGHKYAPGGTITGVTIGVEVRNRGGPGEVFVTVACVERKDLLASKVFYMDEDESVMVRAHFGVFTSGPFTYKIECTARAALPDDTSQGEIQLVRSDMKQVGHLDIGRVKDIAVLGDYAYVVIEEPWPFDPDTAFMADISLKAIDVSNPSNPKVAGRYDFNQADTAFAKYGVCVKDQYAYVAIGYYDECGDNGLHIFNVSDPLNPLKIGQYHIEGGACDVAVAGNYAYVTTKEAHKPYIDFGGESVGERSLLIFDISTPSNPKNVGQCEISGYYDPESITVKDRYAYIVAYAHLKVIDISMPNSPREVITQRYKSVMGTGRHSIAVSDSFAYLTTPGPSLFVFDIGIPSNPIEIGKYSPEKDYSAGFEVSVSGNYAYIAYMKGLLVIDISNSSTPVQVGHYTGMEVSGNCVAVSGNYVYLGGESGLHIIESYR